MRGGFYSPEELMDLGLPTFGRNCLISRQALIIGPENVVIGDDVRIDAFTTILASHGGLCIGDNVHISTHVHLNCGGGIDIMEFAQIATGARIISASDDLSGEHLVGPCVPSDMREVRAENVILYAHAILAAGCTVLPGVEVGEGAVIGAGAVLMEDAPEWVLMAGLPAKVKAIRSREALGLAARLRMEGMNQ